MPSTQRTPLIADDDPTLRKVRRSILPVVFLLYTFNYMDRASISYAQLTMSEDLGIDLDPEHETEATADLFQELRLERERHPVEPLLVGKWA